MKFEVETEQVSVTVTKLQQALDSVSRKRESMFQAIEALNGMWIGQAHDAYMTQCTLDNAELLSVVTEIQEVINAVSTARQSYDSCEQQAVELIAAVNV